MRDIMCNKTFNFKLDCAVNIWDLVKLVFCNRKTNLWSNCPTLQVWWSLFLGSILIFDQIDLDLGRYCHPLNTFRGYGELWTWLPTLIEVAIVKLRGNRGRWRQQWWWGENGQIVIEICRFGWKWTNLDNMEKVYIYRQIWIKTDNIVMKMGRFVMNQSNFRRDWELWRTVRVEVISVPIVLLSGEHFLNKREL